MVADHQGGGNQGGVKRYGALRWTDWLMTLPRGGRPIQRINIGVSKPRGSQRTVLDVATV
jgi:hypothetical protein